MNKLVEEAPYHPGYEDAVVSPAQKYKGVDPAKMIWKEKPLSDVDLGDYEYQLDRAKLFNQMNNKQTKPLSDEEVTDVFVTCLLPDGEFDEHEFARAIEERHGIK